MFRAYSNSPNPQESINLYNRMRRDGGCPDNYTFPFLLKACARLLAIKKGNEVHCLSLVVGLELDVFVQNALISMYSQCGLVDVARKLFDEMPKYIRDVVTWNSMISGFIQAGSVDNALTVFDVMLRENDVKPNGVSFASVLTACARGGLLDVGRKIHGLSVCWGFVVDVYVASSLIDMYAKCGELVYARNVFDRCWEKNIVSWTSMIAGYVHSHYFKEAIELFNEMLSFGVKADSPTVACVVSACGHLGLLNQGKWVHMYCEKNGVEMNLKVKNALIDMYSKCADIEKALEIFNGLTHRDVFSWSAMISGLAMNGKCDEALKLFSEMGKCGGIVSPNEVTFLGILSACSHGGFVDKGFYYFELMTRTHNITPTIEHYGCMVDLLGRANLLVEAEKFIRVLPIKPDAVMWRSLLFACRSLGNVKLGEYVARKVEELEPEKGRSEVLLSNIYASASRWNDVKRVRKGMQFQGIHKEPGCSFIELEGIIHEFYVADKSHQQFTDIHETVVQLNEVIASRLFDILEEHYTW